MVVNITLCAIFVFSSAFFSGAETALFSLSKVKLRRLQEKYSQAKRVKNLLKKPTRLLSLIVLGNMMVNIGLSSLLTAIFVRNYGEEGLILAILLSGIIILFMGEIFPKTLAIYSAEKLSLFATPLLNIFSHIFSPLISLINYLVNFLSKFFIRKKVKSGLSEEELKTALLLSKKEGYITEEEKEMISYVLEFKDTWVSEILTARVDIVGIDVETTQEEVLRILKREKHSKFPVYKESLDNIVGILYAKDVFLNLHRDYHTLLREPIFVPESKKIDDLLKLFWEKNERIAIVLDEYGGTAGLVTLEDIVEEIFGEIYDEFEVPRESIEKIDTSTYRVYGKTPIKTVNIELGLELPEEEDTIAGFLLSQMEKIPRPKEKFIFSVKVSSDNYEPSSQENIRKKEVEFTIERATAKRIVSVILKI
jgi:CBS domain containing-hemolysin-like protein